MKFVFIKININKIKSKREHPAPDQILHLFYLFF